MGHWKQWWASRALGKGQYELAERIFLSQGLHFQARYNAGVAAYQQEKFEEAARYFTEAASLGADRNRQSDAWYNAGNALRQLYQLDQARNAYKKSLRLCPNRPDAKRNMVLPPPPSNQPPPPPPPPPPVSKNQWLDQSQGNAGKPLVNLTPAQAHEILERKVSPSEELNAKKYRKLSPLDRPEKGKKGW